MSSTHPFVMSSVVETSPKEIMRSLHALRLVEMTRMFNLSLGFAA